MASSSAPRPAAGSSGMATTAATISSDYHSLIAEIRKTVGMINSVAVNLERDKKFDEVKELDHAVLEIIKASDECSYFSSAIQSVAGGYQLGEQAKNDGKCAPSAHVDVHMTSAFEGQAVDQDVKCIIDCGDITKLIGKRVRLVDIEMQHVADGILISTEIEKSPQLEHAHHPEYSLNRHTGTGVPGNGNNLSRDKPSSVEHRANDYRDASGHHDLAAMPYPVAAAQAVAT
ncbi:hypothetical protein Taro_002972, partial [Colocasia esculenta]|nr:hypothetical protein [Colocasia esculenta]